MAYTDPEEEWWEEEWWEESEEVTYEVHDHEEVEEYDRQADTRHPRRCEGWLHGRAGTWR